MTVCHRYTAFAGLLLALSLPAANADSLMITWPGGWDV